MTTAELVEQHADLWASATNHPFLDAVRDGTLPEDAFIRWLEQDYLFVVALTRAWGRVLQAAPIGDFGVIAEGIGSFVGELTWFEGLAAELDLRLDGTAAPVASAYIACLDELAQGPYPVAMTAMWTVEAAYLHAWYRALGGAERYAAVVEHWANDAFAAFVERIAAVADRELCTTTPECREAAGVAFRRVLEHETAFWGLGVSP